MLNYLLGTLLVAAAIEMERPPIIREFKAHEIDSVHLETIKEYYGANKKLPQGYEEQALLALSYFPELKDIKIEFNFTVSGPPLQARPTVWSTLTRSAPKRTYLVNIALTSFPMFEPILLHNMPFNAQVGVFGHELAHISDFSKKSFWGMLKVFFGNLSSRYLDNMEYCTDDRTIARGLGYQLLAWSTHVTQVFTQRISDNKDVPVFLQKIIVNERYMRPATIKARMAELELYQGSG